VRTTPHKTFGIVTPIVFSQLRGKNWRSFQGEWLMRRMLLKVYLAVFAKVLRLADFRT
jgi:hypothetical protein